MLSPDRLPIRQLEGCGTSILMRLPALVYLLHWVGAFRASVAEFVYFINVVQHVDHAGNRIGPAGMPIQ